MAEEPDSTRNTSVWTPPANGDEGGETDQVEPQPYPPGYELTEEIARGGMGIVIRAVDSNLKRDVAIKFLLPDRCSPIAIRRFLEEARITAQLQHPNIPPVHEIGELATGSPYLVMKLIQGRTLAEMLKGRSDPTTDRDQFLSVFEQICHAVGYAHSRAVVHRDLKPANVMVGAFGEVQVMDWGLAKVLGSAEPTDEATTDEATIRHPREESSSDETRPGTILGTPAFMPPEQAIGVIDLIDRRSDVFGLGAILCVILTGNPPYRGSTSEEVRKRAARGDLTDAFNRLEACGAEPELIALAKQCLSPELAGRPADAEQLAASVARFRADAERRAREAELAREKAQTVAAQERTRRRLQLALVATAFGLLIVLAFGLWWADRREREVRDRTAARSLVESLADLETDRVPDRVRVLAGSREWAVPALRGVWRASDPGSNAALHSALALVELEGDPECADFLAGRVLEADARGLVVIRAALTPHLKQYAPSFWRTAGSPHLRESTRAFCAACMLAEAYPTDPRWSSLAPRLVEHLLVSDPFRTDDWASALHPVRAALLPVLLDRLEPGRADPHRRALAELVRLYHGPGADAVTQINQRLSGLLSGRETAEARADRGRRQANLALTLILLDQWDAAGTVLASGDDPNPQSFLIEQLPDAGSTRLWLRLRADTDPARRRALLLGLGGIPARSLPPADRAEMVRTLLQWYETDPHPGVHAAAGWVLRQWGEGAATAEVVHRLRGKPRDGREWFVNSLGQTLMVVVPRPGERDQSLAISATEVTRDQFEEYRKTHTRLEWTPEYQQRSPTGDCPALGVLWKEAAGYCNWLNEREGIPRSEWAYVPADAKNPGKGLRLAPDYIKRSGYRLPTVAEVERVVMGSTRFGFGDDDDMFRHYGWSFGYAKHRTWPVGMLKPNRYGLFDVYGNVGEWCEEPAQGGKGPAHITSGGSCLQFPIGGETIDRHPWDLETRGQVIGFRVVRGLDQATDP